MLPRNTAANIFWRCARRAAGQCHPWRVVERCAAARLVHNANFAGDDCVCYHSQGGSSAVCLCVAHAVCLFVLHIQYVQHNDTACTRAHFKCNPAMQQLDGAEWKDGNLFDSAPPWVCAVMAQGFKTPLGTVAISGLMLCPLWAWARHVLPGTVFAAAWPGCLLVPARLLALSVELWVVCTYLKRLLQSDAARAVAAD